MKTLKLYLALIVLLAACSAPAPVATIISSVTFTPIVSTPATMVASSIEQSQEVATTATAPQRPQEGEKSFSFDFFPNMDEKVVLELKSQGVNISIREENGSFVISTISWNGEQKVSANVNIDPSQVSVDLTNKNPFGITPNITIDGQTYIWSEGQHAWFNVLNGGSLEDKVRNTPEAPTFVPLGMQEVALRSLLLKNVDVMRPFEADTVFSTLSIRSKWSENGKYSYLSVRGTDEHPLTKDNFPVNW